MKVPPTKMFEYGNNGFVLSCLHNEPPACLRHIWAINKEWGRMEGAMGGGEIGVGWEKQRTHETQSNRADSDGTL